MCPFSSNFVFVIRFQPLYSWAFFQYVRHQDNNPYPEQKPKTHTHKTHTKKQPPPKQTILFVYLIIWRIFRSPAHFISFGVEFSCINNESKRICTYASKYAWQEYKSKFFIREIYFINSWIQWRVCSLSDCLRTFNLLVRMQGTAISPRRLGIYIMCVCASQIQICSLPVCISSPLIPFEVRFCSWRLSGYLLSQPSMFWGDPVHIGDTTD